MCATAKYTKSDTFLKLFIIFILNLEHFSLLVQIHMVKSLYTSHKTNKTALVFRADRLTFGLPAINDHLQQTNLPKQK